MLAWRRPRSVQHPSTVLALRADPPPGASHGPRPPFGPHRGRRERAPATRCCSCPKPITGLCKAA
ncbi:MAG: hypothetical protein EOS07_22645 [Mesorhizobium sp.]|nr:MAG: hypothetical protein EOS07_22645 [Mesorhizobium sp.]RWO89923.1 MAG: hypothetical protein EOQ95_16100 [Mesorhizobium sp.]RWQ51939.1 MAG: hypothetical protein EOS84_18750 [Mesorhizobium sp.]